MHSSRSEAMWDDELVRMYCPELAPLLEAALPENAPVAWLRRALIDEARDRQVEDMRAIARDGLKATQLDPARPLTAHRGRSSESDSTR